MDTNLIYLAFFNPEQQTVILSLNKQNYIVSRHRIWYEQNDNLNKFIRWTCRCLDNIIGMIAATNEVHRQNKELMIEPETMLYDLSKPRILN